MNLEIHVQDIDPAEDVARFASCRAELALRPLRDRFDSVSVFVRRRADVPPAEAVRCLVVIRSGTRADLVVERSSRNLYVAIHLAVDEAGWALADSCAREQDAYLDRQLAALGLGAAQTATDIPAANRCAA